MSTNQPNPYTVLGVRPGAGAAEITAAYRRAVRAYHPDGPHPDPDRLAAAIAAYRQLRDQLRERDAQQPQHSSHGHDIPVRVRPHTTPATPDLRAGPVRHHPPRS